MKVLTIGHSTRSLEAFIELLQAHDVKRLVDVRTVPRSRHNPQFNKEVLPAALRGGADRIHPRAGVGRPAPCPPRLAEHWLAQRFLPRLCGLHADGRVRVSSGRADGNGGGERIALMCAEAVPWRCHRSLIADALLVRGVKVRHIMSRKTCPEHSLTPWAMVNGKQITYPAETLEMNFDDQRKTHAAE